jgi:hypothetical protein
MEKILSILEGFIKYDHADIGSEKQVMELI